MRNDLPDQLRETADLFGDLSIGGVHPQRLTWIREAADEIERLRTAMSRAADIIDRHLYSQRERDASAILRDALEG